MNRVTALVDNPKANELYALVSDVHDGRKTSKAAKARANELADELNDQGFPDNTIEFYLDWRYICEKTNSALKALNKEL